jgi:hypothetical protein
MSFHLSFAQVFGFQVTEKASASPWAGDTWRYLPVSFGSDLRLLLLVVLTAASHRCVQAPDEVSP